MTITVAREQDGGIRCLQWRFVLTLATDLVLSFRQYQELGREHDEAPWVVISSRGVLDMPEDCEPPPDVMAEARQLVLQRIIFDT